MGGPCVGAGLAHVKMVLVELHLKFSIRFVTKKEKYFVCRSLSRTLLVRFRVDLCFFLFVCLFCFGFIFFERIQMQ